MTHMPRNTLPLSFKKPTGYRFLGALAILWTIACADAWAAVPQPIDVDAAVARALSRPELLEALASNVKVEEAAANQSTAWSNPEVTYERIALSGGEHEETEQTFSVTQSVELSGRRSLRSRAARALARASQLDGESTRRQAAQTARRRFWRVSWLQSQHDVLKRWMERIERASERVNQRRAAGESSTYDLLRVEREARAARAALARTGIEREAAWLRLLELTGPLEAPKVWPRVRGHLLPSRIAQAGAPEKRPDLRAWEERERAADLQLRSAQRGWVPEVGLTAGWRSVDEAHGGGEGLTAGVGLSLPLFDRGQREETLARAQIKRAQAMQRLLSERTQRERRPAEHRAKELLRLAKELRAETERAQSQLETTAEAAWLGGELSLTEFINVHRGARDDELAVLQLEHAARAAREDLRALMLEERP